MKVNERSFMVHDIIYANKNEGMWNVNGSTNKSTWNHQ